MLVVGAALRLAYPLDFVYKYDQRYSLERSLAVGRSEDWPGLGMISGVGTRNPGLSVWVFVVLARASDARDPVDLTRASVWTTILALALLASFARTTFAGRERASWYWAIALAAVNPMVVLAHRKIWAQTLVPLLLAPTLLAWSRRRSRIGSAAWGFSGALLGQLYMPGFPFALGLFLWTVWRDRTSVRLGPWFLGSVAGSLGLIPWIGYVLSGSDRPAGGMFGKSFLDSWHYWLTDPFGASSHETLGTAGALEWWSRPLVGGHETYLVGLAHLAAILLVAALYGRGLRRALADWRPPAAGRETPISSTRLLVEGALVSVAILLPLSRRTLLRHHMTPLFPLSFVFFAGLTLRHVPHARRWLAVLVLLHLLLSASLLGFLHEKGGAPDGPFGRDYRTQIEHSIGPFAPR